MDTNNILVVDVPANCTDRLQLMDLSIDGPFKDHMKTSFQTWYAQQVCLQLQHKQVHKAVDLRLSIVKPCYYNYYYYSGTCLKQPASLAPDSTKALESISVEQPPLYNGQLELAHRWLS